jgi:hypothetical protein
MPPGSAKRCQSLPRIYFRTLHHRGGPERIARAKVSLVRHGVAQEFLASAIPFVFTQWVKYKPILSPDYRFNRGVKHDPISS